LSILLCAGLTIRAEYAGARRQVYCFKPLTTALILALALMQTPVVSPSYRYLVALGLLCSLAGDVFLMLPHDRFVLGLVSFLVAHLVYIAAFATRAGYQLDWFALVPYALFGAVMLARLWPHLSRLRLPVLIYMAVILIMGWQAFAVWRVQPSTSTLAAAVGAALFVLSDSLLAFDRFRRSFRAARGAVLGTYYLAQTLIALSVCANLD
jgi:uncharacterized membrane protein YhhN